MTQSRARHAASCRRVRRHHPSTYSRVAPCRCSFLHNTRVSPESVPVVVTEYCLGTVAPWRTNMNMFVGFDMDVGAFLSHGGTSAEVGFVRMSSDAASGAVVVAPWLRWRGGGCMKDMSRRQWDSSLACIPRGLVICFRSTMCLKVNANGGTVTFPRCCSAVGDPRRENIKHSEGQIGVRIKKGCLRVPPEGPGRCGSGR